jgi:hypothetical protein
MGESLTGELLIEPSLLTLFSFLICSRFLQNMHYEYDFLICGQSILGLSLLPSLDFRLKTKQKLLHL